MLFKTIERLSIPLVANKVGGFFLFHLLLGVVSGSFQHVLACYSLWPLLTSDDVTECFILQIYSKSTLCRFYDKEGQVLLQTGEAPMYHKVEVLLQKGAAFLYYKVAEVLLQSRAIGIAK